MGEAAYSFSPPQARLLLAMRDGRYRPSALTRQAAARVSLVDRMPPVYQQALRGTCVANAVTALLEYYGDCKVRLSVQFLYVATKDLEREGLERNLARVQAGEPPDPPFEAVFHSRLIQLRMLADANGGMQSPGMRPYLQRFLDGAREAFLNDGGTLLSSCFRVVETQGICRYRFWPTSTVHATLMFGTAQRTKCPPGAREDALKRRVVAGLYLLGTPNNVDEIRGILAGANGRRPMPVAITASCFAGCDKGDFRLPRMERDAAGAWVAVEPRTGVHGLLIVGYEDDVRMPGGGFFVVRNSYGEEWGSRGYGRMSYAYLECFALEAGTILQDLVDYEGEGYVAAPPSRRKARPPFLLRLVPNLLIGLLIVLLTVWARARFEAARRGRTPAVLPAVPVVVTNMVEKAARPVVVTNIVERRLPPVVVTNTVERFLPLPLPAAAGKPAEAAAVPAETNGPVRAGTGPAAANRIPPEVQDAGAEIRQDF
ncbi:MAG: C1 family peptidase [Kiritimatiellia bacterium]